MSPARPQWVIEFRNGALFQNLAAKHGGRAETALKFESEAKAKTFMDQHRWIRINGGMAIRCPTPTP